MDILINLTLLHYSDKNGLSASPILKCRYHLAYRGPKTMALTVITINF